MVVSVDRVAVLGVARGLLADDVEVDAELVHYGGCLLYTSRLLVPACAGVAVALIHGARLLPPVLWAASAFSFADGAHLLHGEDGRAGRKGAKTPGVGL